MGSKSPQRQFHETTAGYIVLGIFIAVVAALIAWFILRALGARTSSGLTPLQAQPRDIVWAEPERPAIGVIFSNSERPCLSAPGPRLANGTRVYAITLDHPQRILWSKVMGQRTAGCHPGLGPSFRSYLLDESGWGVSYLDLAVGLVGLAEPPKWQDGIAYATLPDDRTPVSFRQCSSGEGIHVTGWRSSRRIWHAYIYLGYDTVYTCTEEEAR